MHLEPKRILPFLLIILAGLIAWAYYVETQTTSNRSLTYSGTIEAHMVHLSSAVGGTVKNIHYDQGHPVRAGEVLVDLYAGPRSTGADSVSDRIISPIDGTQMEVLVEEGEYASAGAPLVTVTDLNDLTLTVYVPEDRYGVILLGQSYPVTVDSFPGQSFLGTVSYISDQAEFTPRNVQTTDNRKATVFAIQLELEPTGGLLKPGMPADVHFQP